MTTQVQADAYASHVLISVVDNRVTVCMLTPWMDSKDTEFTSTPCFSGRWIGRTHDSLYMLIYYICIYIYMTHWLVLRVDASAERAALAASASNSLAAVMIPPRPASPCNTHMFTCVFT